MPSEMTARAGPPSDASSERNYQAFYGALSASARGRDFLAEYARRNRKADGEKLLAAIDKLQSLLPDTAAAQYETVKRELGSLLVEVNAIQTELDASVLAIKAAKFTELATLVEQRISNILASLDAQPVAKADIPPMSEPDAVEGSERARPWCRYPSSRNCLFPHQPLHSLRQSLWLEAKPSWRTWHLSNRQRNQLRRTREIRQAQPPRAPTSRRQPARKACPQSWIRQPIRSNPSRP